jgi:hypothetical protein
MPKIRTSKTKYPEDWEIVREKLEEFETQMREGNFIYSNLIQFLLLIGNC